MAKQKRIEFEDRGPTALFSADSSARVFNDIKARMGAKLVSEKEKEGDDWIAKRKVFVTDKGEVIEFTLARIAGETLDTRIRRRLYFNNSWIPTVEEFFDQHSTKENSFSSSRL